MRKRQYRARVWLDEKEYVKFVRNVEKSGLSKETYLRQLITGYTPKESPPIEYHEMNRQLTLIGRNLNQIAAKLNSLSGFDQNILYQNLLQIEIFISSFQIAVE